MRYLAQDFARCMTNPLFDQCKQCQRNVNINPVHPDSMWQTWIGPWVGHGPCPNGDFVEQSEKVEPLGPGSSWERDDGLTMTRRVYRHGKLVSLIPIEIIQDTPQMRPFKHGACFGDATHRPTNNQENV